MQKQKRIVVFGRTGAGKSSLGNKIFEQTEFKEGHTLFSETSQSQERIFPWPINEAVKVGFVDTPGFADNRPDISDEQILISITDLLRHLEGGFNIALFCIPAKQRIDLYDLEELKLVSSILGPGAFNNLWITITQLNTFSETTKVELQEKISTELPQLLQNAGFPIPREKILFADFINFKDDFLLKLDQLLNDLPSYIPENVVNYEQQNAQGKNFTDSENMRLIIEDYIQTLIKSQEEAKFAIQQMERLGPNNAILQKQIEKKNESIELLNKRIQNLQDMTKAPKVTQERESQNNYDAIIPKEEWCWKKNEPVQISKNHLNYVEISAGSLKDIILTLETPILKESKKWVISMIETKKPRIFSSLFHFWRNWPVFGIQDEETKEVYSISIQGYAISNMKNTDSFSKVNINGRYDFICELNMDEKRFTVSYGDFVIARSQNPLSQAQKCNVFVHLWKGFAIAILPFEP